jgi:succinate-semialdehyde dehydrogenase/glutarate-semialdehyde dehydrogenase
MGSILEDEILPKGMNLKDKSLFVTKGLVNGQWKDASAKKTFPVYEPSSAEVLSQCADMSLSDFQEAIDSASIGYLKFFTSTTAKERGAILRKWYDLIVANADDSKSTFEI